MTTEEAKSFANKWINSWNSHDLDGILSHYAADIEVTTPMIKTATANNKDSLQGKPQVREYWAAALNKFPDLHFELVDVTAGVHSLALYYKSVMGKMCIEVMFFNAEGKVYKMFAHYT
jgi:ketosteroid isomerase-like protein